MTIALRKTVTNTAAFCAWAASAAPKDYVIYHIGNLGLDRASNATLHDLAETILLLQGTGFVIGSQHPMRLAHIDGWSYVASRTGGGWAPKHLLAGDISATHHRALVGIRDRDAHMSAVRAARDALSCPDAMAADITAYLYARQWIEEAPGKGWQLSKPGHQILT